MPCQVFNNRDIMLHFLITQTNILCNILNNQAKYYTMFLIIFFMIPAVSKDKSPIFVDT